MGDAGGVIIYRLKVSLRGISPMIWRRLVPDDLKLYELHRVVQIAVGSEDYHLHAFRLHGRLYDTMRSGERHYHADGREIHLADLQLRLRQRILYDYDFGDLWEHEIRIEAALEPEPGKFYPLCIGGARAGPPGCDSKPRRWPNGGIVCLGDAVHATTLHLGRRHAVEGAIVLPGKLANKKMPKWRWPRMGNGDTARSADSNFPAVIPTTRAARGQRPAQAGNTFLTSLVGLAVAGVTR